MITFHHSMIVDRDVWSSPFTYQILLTTNVRTGALPLKNIGTATQNHNPLDCRMAQTATKWIHLCFEWISINNDAYQPSTSNMVIQPMSLTTITMSFEENSINHMSTHSNYIPNGASCCHGKHYKQTILLLIYIQWLHTGRLFGTIGAWRVFSQVDNKNHTTW